MDFEKIRTYQRLFVKQRKWEKYHSPKNLSMALSVEAAELVEIFQWLTEEESRALDPARKQHVAEELSDIFFLLLRIVDVLEIDFEKSFWDKVRKIEDKYPPEMQHLIDESG